MSGAAPSPIVGELSTSDDRIGHERVVVTTGRRSGLTVLVALHSTARGPALGG